MPCFHPLQEYFPINKATGELGRAKFCHIGSARDNAAWAESKGFPFYLVPCGQCAGCRSDYAREWTDRLVLENAAAKEGNSWFVTLTYNDESLPRAYTVDRETGVEGVLGVIRQSDISVWIKRIRDRLDVKGGRFYAVSEYGSISRRPHFHCLLFNFPIPDRRSYVQTDGDDVFLPRGTFFSETLQAAWHDDNGQSLGYVSFKRAEIWSIGYCAGYATKKLRGLHNKEYLQLCDELGVTPQPPERATMSNRPGIGVPYIAGKDPRDLWRTGRIAVPDTKNGAHLRELPRVFERPCIEDASDLIDAAKARRLEGAKSAAFSALLASGLKNNESLLTMKEIDYLSKKRKKLREPLAPKPR